MSSRSEDATATKNADLFGALCSTISQLPIDRYAVYHWRMSRALSPLISEPFQNRLWAMLFARCKNASFHRAISEYALMRKILLPIILSFSVIAFAQSAFVQDGEPHRPQFHLPGTLVSIYVINKERITGSASTPRTTIFTQTGLKQAIPSSPTISHLRNIRRHVSAITGF